MIQLWTKVWLTILMTTIVVECMEAPTDFAEFSADLTNAINKAKVEVKEERQQDKVAKFLGETTNNGNS